MKLSAAFRNAIFGFVCKVAASNSFPISSASRSKLLLFAWGRFQIRMIGLMNPELLSLTEDRIEIKVPLRTITTTGLDSMFMGALSSGFDLAGGFLIFERALKASVGMVFKDASIRFLRRADGDVHFVCSDGRRLHEAIDECNKFPEKRVNVPIEVRAYVQSGRSGRSSSPGIGEQNREKGENIDEPVAVANMTLSMKKRGKVE